MNTNKHTYRGIVIPADVTKDCYEQTFSHYTELQKTIGGNFDVVAMSTPDGIPFDIWCDDEGLLKQLDLNVTVLMLVNELTGHVPTIVGDVVVTGGADAQGRSLDIEPKIEAAIYAMRGRERAHRNNHPSTT